MFLGTGYGKIYGFGTVLGAMGTTMLASKFVHSAVVDSGEQPTTMCQEWKAAEVMRMMRKPLESNEEKFLLQNPIFATSVDCETGRATGKYGNFSGSMYTSQGPVRIAAGDLN